MKKQDLLGKEAGARENTAVAIIGTALLAVRRLRKTSPTTSTPKRLPRKAKLKRLSCAWQYFWPSTHPAEVELVQPWAKAIEEATGGQVKIVTSQPNLLQADSIYDGVLNGIADIGISCFFLYPQWLPGSEVFELPGITYESSGWPAP